MIREEILGREPHLIERFGRTGCAYLGKVVSYPGGRYEEVGALYVDVTSPHMILIVGKRGTGKSYTMGVLAEGFGLLEEEYRKRIAVVVIDTMSVFHGLKTANNNLSEVVRMKDFGNLQPRGFGEWVRIFLPRLSIDRLRASGSDVHYDGVLSLPLHEVEAADWMSLFGLRATDPAASLLIRVHDRLSRTAKSYGFEAIHEGIRTEKAADSTKDALHGLFVLVEKLGVFEEVGTPMGKLVAPGQLSVLDISYLGRIGGFDVRTLVVAIIGRRLLAERTLYATLEMQSEAGLITTEVAKDITLKHPLVYMLIDEAHLFLPSGTNTLASDVLLDWIKLGRHPGLSLVLATQEPSALNASAVRQADLMIAHNVTSQDDVDALGKAKQSYMVGDQNIQKIVSTMETKRGLSVVFDDKTRKMIMCRVRPRLTLHSGVDASALPRG